MKTLVLTPHAELIPDQGGVLFSGGWCLTRNMRSLVAEKNLDYRVANYPWDDREKYYQDYLYLMSVYELFLEAITVALNKIHNEQFDKEFWRLLGGPALYTILCHLLDRWRIAEEILGKETFDKAPFIQFPLYAFTPNVTTDLNPDSHDYNHYLISSALLDLQIDTAKLVPIDIACNSIEDSKAKKSQPFSAALKETARSFIEKTIRFFRIGQNNKIFIINSCMPKRYELALNAALLNFPISPRIKRAVMPAVNASLRESLNLETGSADPFREFATKMLRQLMPVYLMEGYCKLEEGWSQSNWPVKPQYIFTSNAFQFNEVFQHYAATKISKFGTKLIVGQHGGVSGILKWSFGEEHQIRIATKFLSWGWKSEDTKIVPGFVLTNLGKRVRNLPSGCLLLTTVPIRRYSHKGGAWAVGPKQSEEFLSDQLSFFRNLESDISDEVLLRIFEHLDVRFETEYVDRWKSNFPKIKIDKSKQPIVSALEKTKLFVYTYNSTGYLETLSMNFPTVMFWNPSLFETKPVFTKHLDELERVGIFHRTPESAAAHINQVWRDLERWWNAPQVQRARIDFVNNFAKQPSPSWIGFFRANLTANFHEMQQSQKEISSVQ